MYVIMQGLVLPKAPSANWHLKQTHDQMLLCALIYHGTGFMFNTYLFQKKQRAMSH